MKKTFQYLFALYNSKAKRWAVVYLLIAGIAVSVLAEAETKGQIINVNQNFQIAFTDLGNNSLKQGEIVKVQIDSADFLFMEVLESSSILSKLGPSRNETYKTSLKDFARVSVGNTVEKVSPANESRAEAKPVSIEPKDVPAAEVELLRNQLTVAMDEILKLRSANDALQKQITELSLKSDQAAAKDPLKDKNVQNVLSQLKMKLDKMDQTISK